MGGGLPTLETTSDTTPKSVHRGRGAAPVPCGRQLGTKRNLLLIDADAPEIELDVIAQVFAHFTLQRHP